MFKIVWLVHMLMQKRCETDGDFCFLVFIYIIITFLRKLNFLFFLCEASIRIANSTQPGSNVTGKWHEISSFWCVNFPNFSYSFVLPFCVCWLWVSLQICWNPFPPSWLHGKRWNLNLGLHCLMRCRINMRKMPAR